MLKGPWFLDPTFYLFVIPSLLIGAFVLWCLINIFLDIARS